MTDAQILTMAVAVIVPLSMLLYSNSRIGEAKDTLRAEMGTLRAEIGSLRTEMNAGFERIENLLKMHVLEHHR
jgi:hypothetical protein